MAEKYLLTDYFNLHNAKQFKESVSETSNTIYYVFASKSNPYTSGDDSVPNIINSNEEVNINPYKEIVFGKKVSNNDIKIMIPRYDWISNTVYTSYRSNIDLSNKNYYAVVNAVSNYHVFKVLDNNGNTASTVKPNFNETGADDEFYSTSDGYVWKYMYSVDRSTFDKFSTIDYIPVVPNANVQGNAISGSIDVILVTNAGSNYNTFLTNTFISTDISIGGDKSIYNIANNASSANDFYNGSFLYIKEGTGFGQIRKIIDYRVIGSQKLVELDSDFTTVPDSTSVYEITPSVLITGDGSNAIARAIVNTTSSNTIHKIEIIQKGSGYTYATAQVIGNTGGVSNSAALQVVLGPKGGHGKDPEFELGGKYLGISVTFANNESNTIPITNDYRAIGLLKDPLFANVELTISTPTGVFTDNEVINQANSLASGVVIDSTTSTVTLANVSGILLNGKIITGSSSGATANVISFKISGQTKDFNTFDNRHKFTFSSGTGTFIEDEKVFQLDIATSNGYYHSNDANYYFLTNIQGTINSGNSITGSNSNAVAQLSTYYPPDIVEGSGEVLYIENLNVVDRDINQSETIKLILKF